MRGTSPVVGKPMGGRMAGAWVHGMGRAPGTEGEGVCGGKTQGGFLGAPLLLPRMKIETPTCGRCERQVMRVCQRDTGQVAGGLPRACPDTARLPQVSNKPWIGSS